MKKIVLIFLLFFTSQSLALEVEGVKLEEKAQFDRQQVTLNGAGMRSKFLVRIYLAALYLGEKTHTDEVVLADSGAKRMTFVLMRDVTGRQVVEGINQAILPNNSEKEMKALDARLFEFEKIFSSVPEIKKGEIVNLDYIPESGTRITINGVNKGHIEGADFYRALLKIWVGHKPVQQSLKKRVLGVE